MKTSHVGMEKVTKQGRNITMLFTIPTYTVFEHWRDMARYIIHTLSRSNVQGLKGHRHSEGISGPVDAHTD